LLGYPKGLIAVEKNVFFLHCRDLNRRADIVCFAPNVRSSSTGLQPLLLIECKASSWNKKAGQQILGYNDVLQAPFIALASSTKIQLFWQEEGVVKTVPFLPHFNQLLATL